MRIIAGQAKGRRLWAPQGSSTRPTPDRVREALFSMLATQVVGARVLDLYAGSGSLGLEALSRGAHHCSFVEHHPNTLTYLRRNLSTLNTEMQARAAVLACSVHAALSRLEKSSFNLVFLDPPYPDNLVSQTLIALCERGILADGALVVAEHGSRQTLGAPPQGLALLRQRSFGEVQLSFLEREVSKTPPS